MVWNPTYVLGFIFDLIILIVAFWAYNRIKHKASLYLGIAFVIFWLHYLVSLVGYSANLENVVLTLRIIAYLITIYAVYTLGIKK